MKITLVRHGQTEANYQKIVQGLKNNLLNETGRRQCQRLREKLKTEHFDVCYMSPLVRTVETAMILIGDRVEMIPDKRIIERDMGELEEAPREFYDVKKYWDYDLNCTDGNVEGVQSVFKRCEDFLNYILEKHYGKDILIVTHGSPFRALYHLLKKTDVHSNLLDIEIDNCSCKSIEIK